MTAPILIVLVTLSVFATPAAAQILNPVRETIFADDKAVMLYDGQCYSGSCKFFVDDEGIGLNFISLPSGIEIYLNSYCRFKLFTMYVFMASDPSGDRTALKCGIVFICGDRVILYAFGLGCFLYFKGTVTHGANNH